MNRFTVWTSNGSKESVLARNAVLSDGHLLLKDSGERIVAGFNSSEWLAFEKEQE